jgi:hypothetical protein
VLSGEVQLLQANYGVAGKGGNEAPEQLTERLISATRLASKTGWERLLSVVAVLMKLGQASFWPGFRTTR